MRVKCVICDVVCDIDDQSSLAKKLRNRPIHTFMCDECSERIKKIRKQELLQVNSAFFVHRQKLMMHFKKTFESIKHNRHH